MNMYAPVRARGELWRQAQVARELGSPFVAAVLEAGQRQLRQAPRTAHLIDTWPDDPSSAALAMRFNAALHALARRGAPKVLESLYQREHDDFDGAIGAALRLEDAFISEWLYSTPQTNEVGRAASIMAALMVVRREFQLPFELLELGSSCGLNLNLGRYGYDLGGVRVGDLEAPVQIAPVWEGASPVAEAVEVAHARGVDLNPLNAGDQRTRERLLSFVWADQPHRARRLEMALAIARQHRPWIDQADASTWLVERLAAPQQAGLCRVAFHSMVLQYLAPQQRATVWRTIVAAGERATVERPLAWISFEWTADRREVHLSLTCWPGRQTRLLAVCHAYGDWIRWQ